MGGGAGWLMGRGDGVSYGMVHRWDKNTWGPLGPQGHNSWGPLGPQGHNTWGPLGLLGGHSGDILEGGLEQQNGHSERGWADKSRG